MEFTAQQIATLLNGSVEGNENASVNNVSKIEEGIPNTLSFLANPKYNNYIYTTDSSIVLVNKSHQTLTVFFVPLIEAVDAFFLTRAS